MGSVAERVTLWIPNFVPSNWDDSITMHLDGLISRFSNMVGEEYERNDYGAIDDPTTWQPRNSLARIIPDRVSNRAVRELMNIDSEIGRYT